MEEPFAKNLGIVSVTPGYMGGHLPNPSYEQVCKGGSGHVEVVEVVYDDNEQLPQLLDTFWRNIDPTDESGQFADKGSQYRPVIFVNTAEQRRHAEFSKEALESSGRFNQKIIVPIEQASTFYPAEAVHCRYFENHAVAYQRYKLGSGRQAFLGRTWNDD